MGQHRSVPLSPRTITAAYLGFGVLWIVVTDWLVFVVFDSPDILTAAQTVKGWMFVILSGLIVFGLTTLRQREIEHSRSVLERVSQQLQVLQRVFRHNVRNDITVIRGQLDLVANQLDDVCLEKATERTEQMARLSDKMQVVSEVDLAETDREPVDLVTVVEDAVSTIERDYPNETISVDAPENAWIRGDPILHRAIGELVENAIEHNPAAMGECEVSITIEKGDDETTVIVRDNGPQIPDHEVEPLRAERETDLSHTSGVGLWIVKWLCEYCKGELRFENNGGTTVTLAFETVDSPTAVDRTVGLEA